nr:hypothetical protein CFP56_63953 [Quercus suber]
MICAPDGAMIGRPNKIACGRRDSFTIVRRFPAHSSLSTPASLPDPASFNVSHILRRDVLYSMLQVVRRYPESDVPETRTPDSASMECFDDVGSRAHVPSSAIFLRLITSGRRSSARVQDRCLMIPSPEHRPIGSGTAIRHDSERRVASMTKMPSLLNIWPGRPTHTVAQFISPNCNSGGRVLAARPCLSLWMRRNLCFRDMGHCHHAMH